LGSLEWRVEKWREPPAVGADPCVCPNNERSLREKFIKNLIQNLSKLMKNSCSIHGNSFSATLRKRQSRAHVAPQAKSGCSLLASVVRADTGVCPYRWRQCIRPFSPLFSPLCPFIPFNLIINPLPYPDMPRGPCGAPQGRAPCLPSSRHRLCAPG